jgi:hypothetical protein
MAAKDIRQFLDRFGKAAENQRDNDQRQRVIEELKVHSEPSPFQRMQALHPNTASIVGKGKG